MAIFQPSCLQPARQHAARLVHSRALLLWRPLKSRCLEHSTALNYCCQTLTKRDF